MKCKTETVYSKSVLKTFIFLRKSPRKLYHIARGWIHEPRTVLESFQDKDKQNILGIVYRPLARNSKSPRLLHIRGDGERYCLLDHVPQKIFSGKIFHDEVNFQKFQIFNQSYNLSSFVEVFCQVKRFK